MRRVARAAHPHCDPARSPQCTHRRRGRRRTHDLPRNPGRHSGHPGDSGKQRQPGQATQRRPHVRAAAAGRHRQRRHCPGRRDRQHRVRRTRTTGDRHETGDPGHRRRREPGAEPARNRCPRARRRPHRRREPITGIVENRFGHRAFILGQGQHRTVANAMLRQRLRTVQWRSPGQAEAIRPRRRGAGPARQQVHDRGDQHRYRNAGGQRHIGVTGIAVHRDPSQARIRCRHLLASSALALGARYRRRAAGVFGCPQVTCRADSGLLRCADDRAARRRGPAGDASRR